MHKALALSGEKLLGIPILVTVTQAEKNRLAAKAAAAKAAIDAAGQVSRLHVSNLPPQMGDDDLRAFFEPFGELVAVSVQREESGRSKGYGTSPGPLARVAQQSGTANPRSC